MQEEEFGFIIKRFLPQKQKISLISQNSGKIEIVTKPPTKILQLWPGMIISFMQISNISSIKIIDKINIISFFENSENFNMNWFHHIFELCYYFIPLDNPCEEVFVFLNNCLAINYLEPLLQQHTYLIKKIYETKLLELFGFYPDQPNCCYLKLYDDLTSSSIDIKDQAQVESLKIKLNKINNQDIKKLETWINNCLKSHPCFRLFKTISFYRDKNGKQKNI